MKKRWSQPPGRQAPDAVPNFEGEHAPEEFIQAVLGTHPELFLSAEEIAQRIVREVLTPSPGLDRLTLRPEERPHSI